MRKSLGVGLLTAAVLMSVMIGMVVNAVQAFKPSRVIQNTYYFTIGCEDYWTTFSVLDDDVYGSTTGTGYVDKYVMTTTTSCALVITVEDCCIMGDTIALGRSAKKYWSATSPETVVVGATPKPGTYVFYVGYIPPHTGLFPAGYDIYVSTFG